MKAIVYDRYGSPEVLRIEEVPMPSPKGDEVLVRIPETIVTPIDTYFRAGKPYIVRFLHGFLRPRRRILGTSITGIVEAVGPEVTQFKPGDEIFGFTRAGFGTHAEYRCVPEDYISHKPANMGFGESAAVVDGGLTAMIFLRDYANLNPKKRLLVIAASGSVGSFAVQLGKYYGAHVTGVCSTRNLDLVRSFGADEVIDYTQEDYTQREEEFDVIFDTIGVSSYKKCKKALRKDGLYLGTELRGKLILNMLGTTFMGKRKAKFVASGPKWTQEDLVYMTHLIEKGKVWAHIDSRPGNSLVD